MSARPRQVLCISVAGLLLASCASLRDRRIDRAAARFHRLLEAGEVERILNESAGGNVPDRERALAYLRDVRQKLGDIVEVTKLDHPKPVIVSNDPWMMNSFEVRGSKGVCRESFVWDISGADARLLRYTADFEMRNEIIPFSR